MDSKLSQQTPSLAAVGELVKTSRRARKMSQSALGEAAGLSRMPVYRIEAGRDISLAFLLALLPPLGLGLSLEPAPTGPLRATDLAKAFAHLHQEDQDEGDE